MVDAGFDLWLYNSRGNIHSEKHDMMDEWSLQEYWDFSWAEMGYYDIPAVIDQI